MKAQGLRHALRSCTLASSLLVGVSIGVAPPASLVSGAFALESKTSTGAKTSASSASKKKSSVSAGGGKKSSKSNPTSVEDFFRRVGDTLAKPFRPPPPPRARKPRRAKQRGVASEEPTPGPIEESAGTPTPAPTPEVRVGAAAARANLRRDVPYGVPVPGRDGFVTSPYAPTQGFVDVRELAPGTPVQDPFTGKVFLRP